MSKTIAAGLPVPVPDGENIEDLEARLRRLRSRMEAEGRGSAVSMLDKAIARASSGRRPAQGK